MDGKEKAASDHPSKLTAESSWGGDDVSGGGYFFGTDKDSSILLSEFGWNIPAGVCGCDGRFLDFEGTGVCAPADTSAPTAVVEESRSDLGSSAMASSSSSEDPTASGGSSAAAAVNPPSDSASKGKKKGPKRIRQQRFAFVTKSDIDHLEDGYRWRKYGQKAVKNSHFPRSYYRCTSSKCTVKKRVERSSEDPSVVFTTYEGQHSHHSVGFPRAGFVHQEYHQSSFPKPMTLSNSQFYHSRPQYSLNNFPSITQTAPSIGGESHKGKDQVSSHTPAGEGLLGDIVPTVARKNG